MKKIIFISAIALTLALGACEKFDLPNPPGQTNPAPEGYFENSSIEVAPVTTTLDLPQANADNKFATVGNITKLVDFPEGYNLEIDMQVGSNDQFSDVTTLPTVIEDMAITVNPDLLNGAIQNVITREPGTLNVPARFVAYATRETTRMRLGGIDAVYGQELLSVKTLDFGKVIEDKYYLVPCNASGAPQLSKAIRMENTAGANVSPYDNPEFAIKLDVPTDADFYWVIAPQSSMSAGDSAEFYGCSASEDGMSGKLGTSYPAGLMPINGAVLVTVNMEADSYTLSYAFDMLYPFSGTVSVENMMKLYTTNYINYTGVTAINNQWTLAAQPDKNGAIVFKQDPTTEPELSENELTLSGILSQAADATTLRTPVRGNTLYWADVNLVQKTYAITALKTISVIGNHNGWNLETAPELTPSKDLRTWTLTDVELDGEFKFNCNGAWDIDFGGFANPDAMGAHVYTIEMKGGNMSIEKGKYDIEINFSALPYVATITKK